MTVLKRDGRTLEFDHARIRAALAKAFVEVHGKLTPLADHALTDLVARIDAELAERFTDAVKIYEIQNVVEHISAGEPGVRRRGGVHQLPRPAGLRPEQDHRHQPLDHPADRQGVVGRPREREQGQRGLQHPA
jgi:hypothetical protein